MLNFLFISYELIIFVINILKFIFCYIILIKYLILKCLLITQENILNLYKNKIIVK